ncbi:MAG: DEAD/DEAH box helicase [Steroidobacteraceae bacterium]|nr:DEAD/DEAH box helicase [Deltaproteobacteria bacterium]
MTQPTTPDTLPPLLKRFHSYLPGDIHDVAAKVHLMAGFETCKGNTLADAVWNEDKTALVVSFSDDSQTTLLVEGYRLLTNCSCKQWQPARNCPHVVIAWATLKRTVSPGTLAHIKFNQKMLLDMKCYTEREPVSVNSVTANDMAEHTGYKKALTDTCPDESLNGFDSKAVAPKASPQFRLVIGKDRHANEISGRIMRNNEVVSGWTTIGIPTELARFLATASLYESTPRYIETFLKLTGGKYPIVFRDADAQETALTYCGAESRRACIGFDIRRDEVVVSRSLDNGKPLPAGAVVHGNLLFVPENGSIFTLENRKVWRQWELVVDELVVDELDPENVRPLCHSVTVPLSHFNSAGIRLNPELFENTAENYIFLLDGVPVARSLPDATSTYLLELPHGVLQSRVPLEPVGLCNGQTFPCSKAVFRYLNPADRKFFNDLMKMPKRLRIFLDSAFALLDQPGVTARNSIFRNMNSTLELAKPEAQSVAKELINFMCDTWRRKDLLLLANPKGWCLVEEDRLKQVQLMRILFELFGLEAFTADPVTGGLQILTSQLQAKGLSYLTSCLQAEGFSLRIGNEPLVAANWEFSLDATVSGLDWFELRPEIRCDGVLLNEQELRALLDGSGMLRRNGCLMTMDGDSAQAFALLSDSMSSKNLKAGEEGEGVRVPRLQILDWLQLRSQGVTVKLAPEDAGVLESLLNFEAIPQRPLPTGLKADLRHYQTDSWHWLAFLYDHRFGACLADDMGLGKTLQGITLLAGILSGEICSAAPHGAPHLVVAPPSLLFNWEAEIARFLPAARVYVYSGTGRSTESLSDCDIVITSYGLVQRDIEQLEKFHFDVIIFDETQVVKNLQASTSNAVRRLKGAFTLGLTGTPVENHLREYYAIMDLCLPGLLGSREEFNRQAGQGEAGITRLIRRTRPFILRRSKQMIAAELPPKIETDIQLELSDKQKALYQRTIEEVRGQVKDAYDSHASGQASIIALTAILRLRQICLSPALISPDSSEVSPKLEFLAEQLLELRDEGHSALVFSQFTGYLDIIERDLKQQGLDCLRLDGSTPVPKRKKLVQAFQNSEEPAMFLISLKAGGRGLNLTRATYVYHMDPWWNPAVENQASDRAHRIGQTGQVTITRLIMRHTIEEKMMTLKEQKLKLYQAILEDGTGAGGAGLTREDLEFLMG